MNTLRGFFRCSNMTTNSPLPGLNRKGYMVEYPCFSADMPHGGYLRAPSAGSKPVLSADGNVAARIRNSS